MDDSMYPIQDEWGHKAFEHPRCSLTGLIYRRAEERQTTRPARAGDEDGVPQKFRLLELEAPKGEVVREAPEIKEETPLHFPNAKAQRRLARTLDQFMVKAGNKPLIIDYGYPEGLSLDNVVEIFRLHLGTFGKHRPSSGLALARASGPAGSSSVKAEGNLERDKGTIRQQMDREAERELQAKREAEAVTAKEEARPLSPIAAITPRSDLKRFREGSSGAPHQASEQPPRAANCRLDVEFIDLLSDGEDAVMTDAESSDSK